MARGALPKHLREQPSPTGNLLVRLADVPLEQRLRAVQTLAREGLSGEDMEAYLMLAVDPGDVSARIAV